MPRFLALAPPKAVAAPLGLGACAATPPPVAHAPYPIDGPQCEAERAHWAIGRAATAEVVEEVRAATQSHAVRVIHPGQAVTMDYSPVRVNIHVNERNAITSITCG